MPHKLWAVLACMTLGVFVAACGSTRLTPRLVLEQPLTQYRTVHFAAEAAVAEDVSKQLSDLEEKVLKQLTKEELFQTVLLGKCTDSCSNAVNVIAMLTDIRKVSSFARIMIGMWAGKATMTSEVNFVDGASGRILGTYYVHAEDANQGDTGSLVSRTAKAIVKLIKTNFR